MENGDKSTIIAIIETWFRALLVKSEGEELHNFMGAVFFH